MMRVIFISFLTLISAKLYCAGYDTSKVWSRISKHVGFSINAISWYYVEFSEVRSHPQLLDQPSNNVLIFHIPDLLIGNRRTFYASFGMGFQIANQPAVGAFQNNQSIRTYCSTTNWNAKLNATIVDRKKVRINTSLGFDFIRTHISSSNQNYYTLPNDTVQYFFLGKISQNFIIDLGLSTYYIVSDKHKSEASLGLTFGYNLAFWNPTIERKNGLIYLDESSIRYNGPYLKLTVLQLWWD